MNGDSSKPMSNNRSLSRLFSFLQPMAMDFQINSVIIICCMICPICSGRTVIDPTHTIDTGAPEVPIIPDVPPNFTRYKLEAVGSYVHLDSRVVQRNVVGNPESIQHLEKYDSNYMHFIRVHTHPYQFIAV